MREVWGNLVIGLNDLSTPASLCTAIQNLHIPHRKWDLPLSDKKIDAIRAAIRPENKAVGANGQIKGIYSPKQESLANEALPAKPLPQTPTAEQRRLWIEEQATDEVRHLTVAPFIRLIRGIAGTGKTDVLVLRAFYLYKTYPTMRILVTTFNRPLVDERLKLELGDLPSVEVATLASLCAEIRKTKFHHAPFPDPQSTRGVLNAMAMEKSSGIKFLLEKYGIDFLEREIQWIKEMRIQDENTYLNTSRRGLASLQGRRLSPADKLEIFLVFQTYQKRLSQLPALDWHDFYNQAFDILEEGFSPPRIYDAILVDEAQHFAPAWIQVLLRLLKLGGHLFLCDDPTQGVYRNYSWKERGVNVVGQTRWLRVPYRYTRQISKFLTTLINGNESLMELLRENNDFETIITEHSAMRDGPLPELHIHQTSKEEKEVLTQRIAELISQGIVPSEIAIVHPEEYVREHFIRQYPGLKNVSPINQTGMEYRVVVMPDISTYFKYNEVGASYVENRLKNMQRFCVAAGRARDCLILSLVKHNRSNYFPLEISSVLKAETVAVVDHTLI